MTNPGYQRIDDYQDVESRNIFAIKQAEGMSEAEILAILGAKSATTRAPRCSGAPRPTPVSPAERPGSSPPPTTRLSTPRRRWRTSTRCSGTTGSDPPAQGTPHLYPGDYQELLAGHPQIWAYARRANGQTLLVVSNFYGEPATFALPDELATGKGACCWATTPIARPMQSCMLRPYESLIWLVE